MALGALRVVLLLLVGDFAASFDLEAIHAWELKTPNCERYDYPGCPRNLNPVCGSDRITYSNECTLCMKIREDGSPLKIIREGPC